jgi:hypothetical protein
MQFKSKSGRKRRPTDYQHYQYGDSGDDGTGAGAGSGGSGDFVDPEDLNEDGLLVSSSSSGGGRLKATASGASASSVATPGSGASGATDGDRDAMSTSQASSTWGGAYSRPRLSGLGGNSARKKAAAASALAASASAASSASGASPVVRQGGAGGAGGQRRGKGPKVKIRHGPGRPSLATVRKMEVRFQPPSPLASVTQPTGLSVMQIDRGLPPGSLSRTVYRTPVASVLAKEIAARVCACERALKAKVA